MEQKQKQGTPGVGQGGDPLEQGGDDELRNLAKKAKNLGTTIEEHASTSALDPRRSMPITREGGSGRTYLYINGTMWVEIDAVMQDANTIKYCIQDCLGHCLEHVEHVMKEVLFDREEYNKAGGSEAGMEKAIEVATQMIRDGSMRSPEEAAEFARTYHTSGTNEL